MVVKLTLDTEGTREAGLDTHVCELQLVLQPMARLLVTCRPPQRNAEGLYPCFFCSRIDENPSY